MTKREALIALLGVLPCESEVEEGLGCPDRKHGICNEVYKLDYCAVTNLADHLIANGVTVQKWIPVSEPPKETGVYQVFIYDKENQRTKVWFGQFVTPSHWSVYDLYGDGILCEVTHWMPMLEPPKEDK